MITIDPRNLGWGDYCARMAEQFAPQQLGTTDETNWRAWADGVQGIGYFTSSGIPDQRNFNSWQDWAQTLCGIMSIETR
jgi:hypothetical protein